MRKNPTDESRRYGRYEDVPEKSISQLIDDEIKMVQRNRFMSDDEKQKTIKKLTETKEG